MQTKSLETRGFFFIKICAKTVVLQFTDSAETSPANLVPLFLVDINYFLHMLEMFRVYCGLCCLSVAKYSLLTTDVWLTY